jgi:NAD(P)-dependent dehydrogenase (short-subunit alcohol dehydrogenase family)
LSTYLLTGGTRGIGHAVAVELASRGHRVVLLARTLEAGQHVAAGLPTPGRAIRCDLADPAAVDAVTLDEPLDGIISLAGVLNLRRVPAPGGVSQTWAANVLGPARLTARLLPSLPDGGTITFVSGEGHRRFPLRNDTFGRSGGLRAAAEVATAKILWVRGMARAHSRLVISTFCPGRVRTELGRGLPWGLRHGVEMFMKTGVEPAVCAPPIADRVLGACPSGSYGIAGVVAQPAPHTDDRALQDAMVAYAARWPSPVILPSVGTRTRER